MFQQTKNACGRLFSRKQLLGLQTIYKVPTYINNYVICIEIYQLVYPIGVNIFPIGYSLFPIGYSLFPIGYSLSVVVFSTAIQLLCIP